MMLQGSKVSTCWVIIGPRVVLDISVVLWGQINPRATRLQRCTELWNFIISTLLCPLFHLAAGHACYSNGSSTSNLSRVNGLYRVSLPCSSRIKGKRYLFDPAPRCLPDYTLSPNLWRDIVLIMPGATQSYITRTGSSSSAPGVDIQQNDILTPPTALLRHGRGYGAGRVELRGAAE